MPQHEMLLTRSTYNAILIAALLLGTASFFLHRSGHPLTYDEGDYLVAVERGVFVNWTDHDDIGIAEFVRMGIGAMQDPASRQRLSDYIRSSGSTGFHRHYHPPLAFYPAAAIQPLVASLTPQWRLRLSNLFWLYIWILALWLIGRRVPQARTPLPLLLPASSAWAMAVVGFNMHLPFGLLTSLFLYCWYLYEEHGCKECRRAAQFFFAASIITVAYGMFLVFFISLWAAIMFWKSGDKKSYLRGVLHHIAWVLLFIALLWPAAFTNLGILKNWVFTMYIALMRLSDEPAVYTGWLQLLFEKWNANPVELLLLVALPVMMLMRPRLTAMRGSLVVALGFTALLVYLQFNPALVYRWYLFPAFAVIFLLFGTVSWQRLTGSMTEDTSAGGARRLAWMSVGIAALLFVSALLLVNKPDYTAEQQLHDAVNKLDTRHITLPRSVLPTIRAHHPELSLHSIHDVAYAEMTTADSIATWRARGAVIVPLGVDTGPHNPDAVAGNYAVFHARSPEELQ
ncbi:MAG: hypothetical protein KFH87_13770 [Bacteroidetes bacterium]|nr:hypothetical protein [Bacteroidota bacterium]